MVSETAPGGSAQDIRARYDAVSPAYDGATPADVRRRLYWLAYEHLTWRPIEALLPADRGLRALDAGGGTGKFGLELARRGHHVTVLDLSPGMLARARERFQAEGLLDRADFQEGNLLALPFADARFELVLCEGDPVSYCLDERHRALRELLRVAAPGAPVVLGVDNRQEHFRTAMQRGDAVAALRVLETGRSVCPYGLPVHAFTEPELREAVVAAGGEVLEIFGKPVLFSETLKALAAARGPGFDAWEARHEVLALQERLAHEGYASAGGHLQVMARKPAAPLRRNG